MTEPLDTATPDTTTDAAEARPPGDLELARKAVAAAEQALQTATDATRQAVRSYNAARGRLARLRQPAEDAEGATARAAEIPVAEAEVETMRALREQRNREVGLAQKALEKARVRLENLQRQRDAAPRDIAALRQSASSWDRQIRHAKAGHERAVQKLAAAELRLERLGE